MGNVITWYTFSKINLLFVIPIVDRYNTKFQFGIGIYQFTIETDIILIYNWEDLELVYNISVRINCFETFRQELLINRKIYNN